MNLVPLQSKIKMMSLVSKEGKAGASVREEGRCQLREGCIGCAEAFGFLPSMIARTEQY